MKAYTKPAVEITALNAEDIIMASVFEVTTVNNKEAVGYGTKSWSEVFGN